MITILTKEKEGATRKKEEEEKKAVVALLVFIMAAVVFCQIKTVGRKKVHLAVTFSKIRLDIHFVIRNRACVALSSGLVNVKETFF